MFRTFFVFVMTTVIILTVAVTSVNAGVGLKVNGFNAYGFTSVSRFAALNHDSTDYCSDWTRGGATGTITGFNSSYVDSIGFKIEYDVSSNKLKFGYAQLYRHVLGGRTSLMFGYNSSAAINAYSGPRGIWLVDWPAAFYGYTTFVPGITFLYERSVFSVPFSIRLASFAKNQLGALVVYGPFNAYCEEQVGHGLVINMADGKIFNWQPNVVWSPLWFHPNIGWSRYYAGVAHPRTTASELKEDRDVFYAQDYLRLGKSIRVYGQYEWGDMPVTWLVGITAEYFRDSFAKLYYNTNTEVLTASLTFSVGSNQFTK